MTVLKYPAFIEGQTLTDDELNRLREYLRDRDRLLGRAIGFGIAGGLGGRIEGNRIKISPGLAIDQRGEPLLLDLEEELPLPPTPDADTFDFVAGIQAADGFSVVLVATDHADTSTPCTETGCNGHAELHTAGVRLALVRGRLSRTTVDFSDDPLVKDTKPLTVTANSLVQGAFIGLRDKIVARVGDRLQPALRAKLAGLTLNASDDLPAIKAYKAAFLNQVLFAALDLIRFESLMRANVMRTTNTPGVVVGWVHEVGGVWTWDCGNRHQWEPVNGLTLAFLGGQCSDPGRPWVDRIDSLIATFELPPAPPKPSEPPVVVDPGGFHICKHHKRFAHDDCSVLTYPELEVFPDDWYREPFDLLPELYYEFPPKVDPHPDWEIYDFDEPDYFDTGVIDLGRGFGGDSGRVKQILTDLVTGEKLTPNILVVSPGDLPGLHDEGYLHTGVVSPSDTIVLVEDSLHKVVMTGRISAEHSARGVGTALPQASRDAQQAITLATSFEAGLGLLDSSVKGLQGNLGLLDTQFQAFDEFTKATSQVLDGLDQTIDLQIAQFQQQFSATLPGLISNVVDGLRVDLTTTMRETTELREKVVETTRKLQDTTQQLHDTTGRIDILYTRTTVKGIGADRDALVTAGLVDVLGTMSDAVTLATAGADAAVKDRVIAKLAGAQDGIGRLRALGAAGGSPLSDNPQTLITVMDSLIEGLAEAGAPAASVKNLRVQARNLKTTLGQ